MENLITKDDLVTLKADLICEIREIIYHNKPSQEVEFLTTLEARKMLRVSVNSLAKIRNEFGLTRTQILGKFYYKKSEIQAILEQNKEKKKC